MGNYFGKMTGVFCFHYLSSFFFREIKMTSTDFHVEAIDPLCVICGCFIMKNGHHILLVLKEAMSLNFERSCWTQRCPLFRGVRYSEVSAIQRCPLFRGVRYSEVSAFQRCPLFRGVRFSEVSAFQRCPLFRGVRFSEVSAFQRCPLFRGVRYSEVSAIQRCPLFRGFNTRFCINSCRSKKMCPLFGGVRY